MTATPTFETLRIGLSGHVATVELHRPEKANAMNLAMWYEIRSAFTWADETPAVRVAVLSGAGRHFTAGMDLSVFGSADTSSDTDCGARGREKLRRFILDLQDTLTSLERCRKPVIAAIHGPCIGGGIDLITCADMRYCSAQASFSVKEIDVGMVADVGTLQRLPRLVGDGMARELAYTARIVDGDEAEAIRLVNRCYATGEELQEEVRGIAETIARKSPLAIRGCKDMISYARDHSVADGLDRIATWNAAMLRSRDMAEALAAMREQRAPQFDD